ncbi:MAG: hypothetical protein KDK37_10885, partial [Leptospiraceae bacterium]|nr:hypothetical protein [Leptospiraceae bacterium]
TIVGLLRRGWMGLWVFFAYISIIAGITIFAFTNSATIPLNLFTRHAPLFGSMIEMAVLAVFMGLMLRNVQFNRALSGAEERLARNIEQKAENHAEKLQADILQRAVADLRVPLESLRSATLAIDDPGSIPESGASLRQPNSNTKQLLQSMNKTIGGLLLDLQMEGAAYQPEIDSAPALAIHMEETAGNMLAYHEGRRIFRNALSIDRSSLPRAIPATLERFLYHITRNDEPSELKSAAKTGSLILTSQFNGNGQDLIIEFRFNRLADNATGSMPADPVQDQESPADRSESNAPDLQPSHRHDTPIREIGQKAGGHLIGLDWKDGSKEVQLRIPWRPNEVQNPLSKNPGLDSLSNEIPLSITQSQGSGKTELVTVYSDDPVVFEFVKQANSVLKLGCLTQRPFDPSSPDSLIHILDLCHLVVSPDLEDQLQRARDWLDDFPSTSPLLILVADSRIHLHDLGLDPALDAVLYRPLRSAILALEIGRMAEMGRKLRSQERDYRAHKNRAETRLQNTLRRVLGRQLERIQGLAADYGRSAGDLNNARTELERRIRAAQGSLRQVLKSMPE